MQAEMDFLEAESQRKEKEAKEREERLEKKIEVFMTSLGLWSGNNVSNSWTLFLL